MICKTPQQRAIFDRIEERIDAEPRDGISAEGFYSEHVHAAQQAFVQGLRSARLAAINALANLKE
jgi:hypothetical protein